MGEAESVKSGPVAWGSNSGEKQEPEAQRKESRLVPGRQGKPKLRVEAGNIQVSAATAHFGGEILVEKCPRVFEGVCAGPSGCPKSVKDWGLEQRRSKEIFLTVEVSYKAHVFKCLNVFGQIL